MPVLPTVMAHKMIRKSSGGILIFRKQLRITALFLIGALFVLTACSSSGSQEPGTTASPTSSSTGGNTPSEVDALYTKGRASATEERWADAIMELDQVIALESGRTLAYYYRGRAHLGLEQPNESISDFNKALDLDSSLDQAYY